MRPEWSAMRRGTLSTWSLVVLAAGLLARTVRFGLDFPIWGDEAFVAVNFLTRDLAGLMSPPLDHDMVVPAGFLALEWLVAAVAGPTPMALRLAPFLAGAFALVALWRWAPAWIGRHAGLSAAALLAASYYPIRHAAEVKPYAFDLLLGLVLFGLAERVARAPRDARRVGALTLAAALAVWFSYPVAFVVAGVYLALALTARPALLAAAVLPALSFAAMYATIGAEQQWDASLVVDSQWEDDFPPTDDLGALPLWLLKQHTGRMFAHPNGGSGFGSAGTTLLVAVGAVALWRRGSRTLVAGFGLTLAAMLAASLLGKYPYGGTARTNLHLAAPIALLAGAGVVAVARAALEPRRAGLAVRGFVALMVALAASVPIGDLGEPWKDESDQRARELAIWLAEQSAADEPWVLWGHFGGGGVGPDLLPWGGSAARVRYDLEIHAPAGLAFAPEASALPAPPFRLIAYRDNEAPFPESDWSAYLLDAIEARGAPVATEVDLDDAEGVVVLRFPAGR